MDNSNNKKKYEYDAFITYSRKDKAFAEKLEKALENYKPPKDLNVHQRNLNIFRDIGDMTGSEYYESIEKHLSNSAKLIVICSPDARTSDYVNDEIRRFTKLNDAENIIPILLSGIPNNEAKEGQESEKAFPGVLCEAMEMPLATSYLGFRFGKDRVNKGVFEGSWYTILANIYTISREEIEQRDKKRQIRRLKITTAIVSAVMLMLIALAAVALWQRDEAIQKLYQANYNLAKVFEEKAGIALADAVANHSEKEYQKAWLYTLAALDQEIAPDNWLPVSLGRFLLPELRIGAFREVWHSPTPASDAGESGSIPKIKGSSPRYEHDWILETRVGNIGSVVFSPDGKCLAAAYLDRTIRMWNVASGEEVMTLLPYPHTYQTWNPTMRLSGDEVGKLWLKVNSQVSSITFSPDGNVLASGSSNGGILLWDTINGKAFAEFTGHQQAISSMAFSPNGKYLAAGSLDNIISLWYVENTECITTFRQHTSSVRSVAFSPDGKLLASCSGEFSDPNNSDNSIRLWDLESHKQLAVLTGHSGAVRSVAFHPNGEVLASGGSDRTIHMWDVKSRKELAVLSGHTSDVTSVKFGADGNFLASGSDDHTIRLWDVKSGKELTVLSGHRNAILSIAFSPSSNLLASSSGDRSIRLWDLESRKEVALRSGHTSYVNSVAFDPAGKYLASGSNDNSICFWDVETGKELKAFVGHGNWVNCVAFSPDGKCLASGSSDHSVRLWDTDSGQELAVLAKHTNSVWDVVFSPDGKLLASCSGDVSYRDSRDYSIRLWDVESRKELAVLSGHTSDISSVAFSPDGKLLASCSGDFFDPNSSDNSIRLWDVESHEQLAVLTGHSGAVRSVAFHPNGEVLASGGSDRTIRIWDVKSRKELAVLSGHTSDVSSVVFSPDGEFLVSGSRDHSIRLWDNIKTGEVFAILSGHTDHINSVAFAPEGNLLASGSRDHSIRLWDIGYDRPLEGPLRKYNCSAFSPEGSLLALGKKAGGISLWDMRSNREYGKLEGHIYPVTSISFSPDGKLLASASEFYVKLWDVELLKESAFFMSCPRPKHEGHPHMSNMMFSRDGKRFAYVCGEDTIMLRGENIQGFLNMSLFPNTVLRLVLSPDLLWIASCIRGPSYIPLYNVSKEKWTRLEGHGDYVQSLAFSPDSKLMASGSLDNSIRLWDVESGEELETLAGRNGVVREVAFSPDGKRLASGSDDHSIRLWDVQSGQELAVLTGHADTVWSVAFSPDGKQLASKSGDGNIRLWDTENGEELAVLTDQTTTVRGGGVAFSPDGKWLRSDRLWNINHLKYCEVEREKNSNFEKIYEASFYLLPYSFEGSRLVPERCRSCFIPVNGYQFPNNKFQTLLRPRSPDTGPVEWILENME